MSTLDVSASTTRKRGAIQRARLIRSAIILVLGPTLLFTLYLLFIAPPQYHSEGAFAVRGAQSSQMDALSTLGLVAPTSNAADAKVVENYIRSDAMVLSLRQQYGFDEAFNKFSLDPTARLSPNASLRSATAFWRHKIEIITDPATSGAKIRVSAYSAEDSQRLARGVLQLSENLVNTLPRRALDDLIAASDQEILVKRQAYDAARDALTGYQGRQFSGVGATTPAQQAIALVGQIEGQLAQKRADLATRRQTFQEGAPQLTGLEREIVALEAERDRAVNRAMSAPGERAASTEIEAQSLLLDYQTAQQQLLGAVAAAEQARRQQIIDRKYVISYVPPQLPQTSDWWPRLANILAVLIGASMLWGIGALVYSIIRDHVE